MLQNNKSFPHCRNYDYLRGRGWPLCTLTRRAALSLALDPCLIRCIVGRREHTGRKTVYVISRCCLGLGTQTDVIKWKHFPRYWPLARGIPRWPVNSPYKAQWRGALMFSLIRAWTNNCVNNRDAGDLRRHRVHYNVAVMIGSSNAKTWFKFDPSSKLHWLISSLMRNFWGPH